MKKGDVIKIGTAYCSTMKFNVLSHWSIIEGMPA
ncbi:MAG: hypothetical protein CM1200mP28_02980 [Deltaproteobacteria bacterium]|nr:MAG: hypothetical protein CM1200mP28_02980 [Deltaproteobacteria bacterium]